MALQGVGAGWLVSFSSDLEDHKVPQFVAVCSPKGCAIRSIELVTWGPRNGGVLDGYRVG